MEAWHLKFARLREGKGWSLRDAAIAFAAASNMHTDDQADSVRRQVMRWESGAVESPSPETKATIARMFDLPVADFFPEHPPAASTVPAPLAPDEFTELVGALQMPRVGESRLVQAEAEVERLCTAYASQDAASLTTEANKWMRTLADLVNNGRVNLSGHRRVVHLTGWLALLRSCLMWDQGNEAASQHARVAAEEFARELDDGEILAWSWEIRAWTALTQGDMPQVIAASDAGIGRAPTASVVAQLHAQKAKAYSRLRDNHKTEVALEEVRLTLDRRPMPHNVRNHFAVDPTKASFYAMDAYRVLGSDRLADAMADTVIQTSSLPGGESVSPMRLAEALLTKAVVLARAGDIQGATDTANQALTSERRSAPSLQMVAGEVAHGISRLDAAEGAEFVRRVHSLTA